MRSAEHALSPTTVLKLRRSAPGSGQPFRETTPASPIRPAPDLSPVCTFRVNEKALLERITVNPAIFAGKSIIRGRRLAVEHVLGMLAAGDTPETILAGYPWLEPEDIQTCFAYAHRLVAHERVEPLVTSGS